MDAQTIVQAAESGDTERLEALLGEGVDVNAKAGGGQTALLRAASGGHRAAVELLLDWGAEVNAQKNDGFTALMLAAFFGHAEVVDVLLAHGADPNMVDELGSTAMRWAAARDHAGIARSIKEAADGPRATAEMRPDAPPPVKAPVAASPNLTRAAVPQASAMVTPPSPSIEEIAPPAPAPPAEREAESAVLATPHVEETLPSQVEMGEDAPAETTEMLADETLDQRAAFTPPVSNSPAFVAATSTVPSAPSRLQIDVASTEPSQSFDAAEYPEDNAHRFAWVRYAVLALVVALVSGGITWVITEPKKPAAAADTEPTVNAGNTLPANTTSSATAPPVTGGGASANESRNAARNNQTQGAIDARRPSPTGDEARVLSSALDDWIAATNARELDRQMNYYAPRLVAYYQARNVSASAVRAEKRRLYARAGRVSLRTSQPEITFSADGSTAFMRFRKLYTFGEGTDNRSGEVLQELIWRKTNDSWRIVSERDVQVIR